MSGAVNIQNAESCPSWPLATAITAATDSPTVNTTVTTSHRGAPRFVANRPSADTTKIVPVPTAICSARCDSCSSIATPQNVTSTSSSTTSLRARRASAGGSPSIGGKKRLISCAQST